MVGPPSASLWLTPPHHSCGHHTVNKLRFSTNGDGHHNRLDTIRPKPKLRTMRAKTPNQQAYIDAIDRCDITFCLGPAGSGKTFCAAGMAARYLKVGEVKKIICIRPAVEAGRSIGYLPGDLDSKLHPYLRPLMVELDKFVGTEELRKLRQGEFPTIEMGALSFLRGSNFEDSIVIFDEAQNATHAEMWMFLTRLSYGSKLIINGDVTQSDLIEEERGALEYYAGLYPDYPEIATVRMTSDDVVRHPLVKRMMERQSA